MKSYFTKRSLAVFLSVLLTSASLAGCAPSSGTGQSSGASGSSSATSQQASSTDVKPVKIAAFYNLSGASGDAGALSKKGWTLAVNQINAAGGIKSLGGAPLEIVVGDTMTDTAQAKSVAERVLQDNDILAAIGVGASAQGLPQLPVFEKNNVAFVHNGIGDTFTTQGYTTVFQQVSAGSTWGEMQVEFLQWMNQTKGLNITKVGACYENSDNGISNEKSAKTAAQAAGLQWVYDESFTQGGVTDATPLVVKMKQSGAQLIFLNGFTQDIKVIMSAMNSLNYKPVIFGAGAAVSFPVFAQDMGDAVNGILLVDGFPWDNTAVQGDPMTVEAVKKYESENNEFFCEPAAAAYMGVRIIAAGLEAAGSRDREKVKEAIRNVHIPSFAGGATNFDKTGKNLNATPFIEQWQKGEDGKYRYYCIYPEKYASKKFQVPENVTK